MYYYLKLIVNCKKNARIINSGIGNPEQKNGYASKQKTQLPTWLHSYDQPFKRYFGFVRIQKCKLIG